MFIFITMLCLDLFLIPISVTTIKTNKNTFYNAWRSQINSIKIKIKFVNLEN